MNLTPIAEKLIALNLGVPGTSLFIDEMPSTCKFGILVRSPLIGTKIDHELPKYFKGQIQVIVRSSKRAAGDALAYRIMDELTLHSETLVDDAGVGVLINQMLPETLPIIYPRSDGNGIEWSINFDLVYVLLP